MKLFINLLIIYMSILLITTTKQRHDFLKSYVIHDLDDKIVALGLISDEKLHSIGKKFGFCNELRYNK